MPNKNNSEENNGNSDFSETDEEGCQSFVSPEMDNIFNKPYHLEQEEAISMKKNYILHMSTSKRGSEVQVAVGMSSAETNIYSLSPAASLQCTRSLPAADSPLAGVRFAPSQPSLLYVGCNKGTIKLWDLRDAKKPAQEFKDTSEPKEHNMHDKRFCSVDVNCDGRFLCAGTEVTDGDAYLLFWDTRQAVLRGGYWECHRDDVTQVSFHPSDPNQLVSGSTDGLINLYDISQSDEDEALLQSFNTDSSVEKLRWHGGGANPTVSCVTHTYDVQFWHLEDSSPYSSFSRSDIGSCLQVDREQLTEDLYVADVHSTSHPGSLMVLAGSNTAQGKCMRSVIAKGGKLSPQSYFDGNKQIVRCSWFDPQNDMLITGGEAGILSVWRSGTSTTVVSPTKLKAVSKLKEKPHKRKSKPY